MTISPRPIRHFFCFVYNETIVIENGVLEFYGITKFLPRPWRIKVRRVLKQFIYAPALRYAYFRKYDFLQLRDDIVPKNNKGLRGPYLENSILTFFSIWKRRYGTLDKIYLELNKYINVSSKWSPLGFYKFSYIFVEY